MVRSILIVVKKNQTIEIIEFILWTELQLKIKTGWVTGLDDGLIPYPSM